MACTTDGGLTWVKEPELLPVGQSAGMEIVGLPPDGSLLVLAWPGSPQTLYRLPASATQWQTLGVAPPASGGVAYYPTADGPRALREVPPESAGASTADHPDAVYSTPYPSP